MSAVPVPERALKCRLCTRMFRLSATRERHMRAAHGAITSLPPRWPGRPQAAPVSSNTERGAPASVVTGQRHEPATPDFPRPPHDGHHPSRAAGRCAPGPARHARPAASVLSTPPEQEALPRDATQPGSGDVDQGDDHLEGVTAYTASLVPDDVQPPAKKRRATSGRAVPQGDRRRFATLGTQVRAMYEDVKDWQRTTSLVTRRKRCRPGQFESYRLRAVERFALECGGAGLSLEWQERLYDLLDTWDGTKPGMPQDDGHNQTLREAFPTSNSFKNAIKDDVDDAVLEQGWCKCTMDVDGLSVTAFLCPALDVLPEALGDATHVQYWSGPDGPAHPTVMRETPFDGDAFRLNEKHVVTQHGPDSFVLGVHLFSDASHISESGGKCESIWGVICAVWPGCGACGDEARKLERN